MLDGQATNQSQDTPEQSAQPEQHLYLGLIPSSPKGLLEEASLKEVDYNAEKARDEVRSRVTYYLMSIFAGTILFVFILFFCNLWLKEATLWTDLKDLLETLLPAETALIGSAVGFYFGSKAGESDHSSRHKSAKDA